MSKQSVAVAYDQALQVCQILPSNGVKTTAYAEKLRSLLLELRDMADASAFLQGGCLVRLEYAGLFQMLPEGKGVDWPTFCEEVLGISIRRGQYLMAMYTKSVALGVDARTVHEVGPAKMRELLTVATRENVEHWIKTARNEPFEKFVGRVRTERKQLAKGKKASRRPPERDEDATTRWGLLLTDAQRRNVEDALRLARKEVGDRDKADDAALLDLIVTDWRANRLPRDRSIKWHARQLARAYKVQIIVKDLED